MASTTPKTIVLSGLGIRKEAIANATITPGHLIEKMSTGKVRKHATAAGNAQRMFAVEDDLQGKTISDDYAAASIVQYNVMARGEEVLATIADGQTIVIGDPLESAGDGTLRKHVADIDDNESADTTTIYTECIIGWAMEAIDLSDSSGADPASSRIAVEIA